MRKGLHLIGDEKRHFLEALAATNPSWDWRSGKGLPRDELAAWRAQQAALIVKLRLAQEDAFWEQVTRVRGSSDRARAALTESRAYASGAPWRVVARLLLDAARRVDAMERRLGREPERTQLEQWATAASFVPEYPPDRKTKPYIVRSDFLARTVRSAELLADRGAGRCLEPGCSTLLSRQERDRRRQYCNLRGHGSDPDLSNRLESKRWSDKQSARAAERKDVERTLKAVAKALALRRRVRRGPQRSATSEPRTSSSSPATR